MLLDPEELDDDRSQGCAGRHAQGLDSLDSDEHARHHPFVGEPGGQRERPDVDERIADPHDGEQRDRRGVLRHRSDPGDRQAPKRNTDPQPPREPPRPDDQ